MRNNQTASAENVFPPQTGDHYSHRSIDRLRDHVESTSLISSRNNEAPGESTVNENASGDRDLIEL